MKTESCQSTSLGLRRPESGSGARPHPTWYGDDHEYDAFHYDDDNMVMITILEAKFLTQL